MKHLIVIFTSIALLTFGAKSIGAVIIDDSFDDGNIATNTTGIGSGFGVFTQNDSTVDESGGEAILSTGPVCDFCISGITSNESFDFFSTQGATISWEGTTLNGYATNADQRSYLEVVSTSPPFYDERLNPQDTNRPGVYIRLGDSEFPFGSAPGFVGGLIVEDGTGAYDELATWSWGGIWDGTSALDIVLSLDDMGFNVGINGNLGNTSSVGVWSDITNATGFSSHWATNAALVAAQNQGLIGIGSTNIERITVAIPISVPEPVPEPSVIALLAVGLFGLGFARRRKHS